MTSEKLRQAVQLIKSGNKQAALPLLKEVVQADPNNENAWLWIFSCVDSTEQKKYCLQQALRINPDNIIARTALVKLEKQASEKNSNIHPLNTKQDYTKNNTKRAGKVINPIAMMVIISSIILFILCGIFFLIANIGVLKPILSMLFPIAASNSIDTRYADAVAPAIEPLISWKSEYANLLVLLNEPIASPTTGHTRIESLALYNYQIQLGLTKSDALKYGLSIFPELDALVAPSKKLSDDGYKILNVINIVTPAYDIEVVHNQVIKCIQLRITITDGFANSIPSFQLVDLSALDNARDCDTFDAAVEKLIDFVNINKSK